MDIWAKIKAQGKGKSYCCLSRMRYWPRLTLPRRVLGQGAVVLLITDGLDRDDAGVLSKEIERLHLSCRRLIWLNPLLRWRRWAK